MISAINCTTGRKVTAFKASDKETKKETPNKSINGYDALPGTKRLNYTPAAIGIINGGCWFGVGMLFDKMSAKLFKSKVNTPAALICEAALGLFMGVRAYKVAKKENAHEK